ncbi:PucR family transcriptional regulator [Nocardia cyriacigeorgica]|uniref:PucR family transcriptional regulator n=2 Tax=Nocardia cyriacigeorgica TaxID=135487 RepID=UPI001894DD3D|nr:helix-turn-helix domain-containing protein [Nocardia cyriacigeorgica]MBF6438206.1 helix-turn-helix domain-containing protein [Nocardia cyriacigeorgica]MBF6453742.1 helix-turn-helix domain-containing protein [Nocardia cyriacigeorgica]MBF6550910.1 helix-turn-helix domain-containing protein [Nocardia cyriacigeorgica]
MTNPVPPAGPVPLEQPAAGGPAPTNEQVRYWLAEFVYETLRSETLDQVVARLDNAIVARIPELADRDMRRDLAASTRAHARVVLSGLTSDTIEPVLPHEAHAFAKTLARRGFELKMLLRTYHAGLAAVLDYFTEALDQRRTPYPIERVVMMRMFERATQWVGASVETLTETYLEERERVLRAALNRRTETVRALLAGDDVDLEQASTRLGYRLNQQHLGVVLWADEPAEAGADSEMSGVLDRVCARLAAELGSNRVLTVASGASGMWAWIGLDGAPDRITEVDGLAHLVEAPVRIALGVPGERVAGFRRSHEEAMAARHVAERGPANGPRITAYREVEIAYLAGVDETAMRALIARELRALARRDAGSARLRETLRAYLRSQHSPEAAAKLLGVHKNTVRYRIQRIEELLGHRIDERALPLQTALACVAAYGQDVLPGDNA